MDSVLDQRGHQVNLVNGSHIKSWWIRHHFWSAASLLLMLGLPVYSPGGSGVYPWLYTVESRSLN